MAQYYIGKNNQRQGPFEIDQLLANGLTPDTLVWCSGMPGWQKANEEEHIKRTGFDIRSLCEC